MKAATKHSAGGLAGAPGRKKAVVGLTEEYVLGSLQAVGREFSVSESTVLSKVSLNRTHGKQGYVLSG